jgi:hypothetical protein
VTKKKFTGHVPIKEYIDNLHHIIRLSRRSFAIDYFIFIESLKRQRQRRSDGIGALEWRQLDALVSGAFTRVTSTLAEDCSVAPKKMNDVTGDIYVLAFVKEMLSWASAIYREWGVTLFDPAFESHPQEFEMHSYYFWVYMHANELRRSLERQHTIIHPTLSISSQVFRRNHTKDGWDIIYGDEAGTILDRTSSMGYCIIRYLLGAPYYEFTPYDLLLLIRRAIYEPSPYLPLQNRTIHLFEWESECLSLHADLDLVRSMQNVDSEPIDSIKDDISSQRSSHKVEPRPGKKKLKKIRSALNYCGLREAVQTNNISRYLAAKLVSDIRRIPGTDYSCSDQNNVSNAINSIRNPTSVRNDKLEKYPVFKGHLQSISAASTVVYRPHKPINWVVTPA